MYFAENNLMYKFTGSKIRLSFFWVIGVRNKENLTDFIDNERWQDMYDDGEEIPVAID